MQIIVGEINVNHELDGQGDCLVLIHGFSDNLGMWYNQVPEFSKHYQVLTYDFRGHGRTRIPEGEISMEMHVDDLSGLLKTLEIERTAVLGYSMGGRIALEFALKYPEMISGLVIANIGVAGKELKMSEQEAELMGKHIRMMTRLCETGDIEAIAEELVARSLSREFQARWPDACRHYKELKLQNDPKHYPSVMQAMLKTMESPPDFSLVQCPVLLIAGENDPYMNLEVVKAMEKDMPRAVLKILPAGHAAAIEMPEMFNEVVLDFMNRL